MARGGSLGEVDDFVVDARTWTIRDRVVDTRRLWPGGRVRISPALVERVDWSEGRLHLTLAKDT